MKSFLFSLCVLTSCAAAAQDDPEPKDPSTILIKNVAIVDVKNGQLLLNQAILIKGDRIVFAGNADGLPKTANVELIIDAVGKFAIPGLWDMHIHTFNEKFMELFPLNGIVGTRVMWGMPIHHSWRKKFESGESLGPRMIIASAIIDGKNPIWPGSIIATDKETGIQAVEKAIEFKADFAKVYSLLPREAYFAIAKKCKRENLPFDGHVPLMISPFEASNAGQRCMAHMYELILGCSSREGELRELKSQFVANESGNVRALFKESAPETMRRAYESYDEDKAKDLFATFKKNGTWHCPTLTVLHNIAYMTEPRVQENPNLKYINKMVRNFIAPKQRPNKKSDAAIEFEQLRFKMNLRILAAMHDAGVPLLAGTDVMNPFCLPGFSLHDELQLMVDAGLKPEQALKTATINPAIFQGKESEFGSIEKGKAADIVLLSGNPLESISNTKNIDKVIIRGAVIDRRAIDKNLAERAEAFQ